ncbi:AAA family ATPase [Cetobacterium sp.]|uniref:AAA family ATPase n=1 Tax=Cetobacterium sp. TaxID=2071632 RepID=UPI003F2EDAB5
MTPLARASNYNLENLKRYLNLYKTEYNKGQVKDVEKELDKNFPGYLKTYYQSMGQLGLEYKEKDGVFLYQEYLKDFNDEELNMYIQFWFMTYFCPNYRVSSSDNPEIIYISILKKLLNSKDYTMSYDDFNKNFLNHGSKDILENLVINFGKYINYEKNKNIYLNEEDIEKVKNIMLFIETNFPIPKAFKSGIIFFERYSKKNYISYINYINSTTEIQNIPYEQEIVYGAPGTGKSYYVNEKIKNNLNNVERVTFYDGYSYNNFIGSYKPIANKDNITYEFVAGPFFRILEKAYKSENQHFYLVIEEINRGCADKIFGNIFQLLDRKDNGESMYPISLSQEQEMYLKNKLEALLYEKTILSNKGLYLPSNLSIYATMNSGDQNVYPLDAAFKRRWKFKYIGLNDNKDNFGSSENSYFLKIDNYDISWEKFRNAINSILLDSGIREDRLIAPFFINQNDFQENISKNNEFVLDKEIFKSKILMYLYEDILKYNNKSILFSDEIKSFSGLLESFESKENSKKIKIFNEKFYAIVNDDVSE